jgi:hypothetical protein
MKYRVKNDDGTLGEWVAIDVIKGEPGKTAYQYAKDGGYTGTEAQFAAKLSTPIITPEMYGAKGDNATDDSAAIQAAIDAAGRDATIYLGKKTYLIASTLKICTSQTKFVCDGVLSYIGAGAAVKIYKTNSLDVDIYGIQAPNGTALLMDSTDGEIGNCIISIKHIFASKTGVHIKGDGSTKADNGNWITGHNIFYNKLHLEGGIVSTDTCILVEAISAYVAENYFWVGRIYGGATYGIRLDTSARNIFHGGNFEGLASDGYSIYMHDSSQNTFYDFRTEENYGAYIVGFSGTCEGNDVGVSNMVLSQVDTSALTSTGSYRNILRSQKIVGGSGDNLSGLNKVWLSMDGFSSETSDLAASLQTETWIFTMEDGATVEKQVVAS